MMVLAGENDAIDGEARPRTRAGFHGLGYEKQRHRDVPSDSVADAAQNQLSDVGPVSAAHHHEIGTARGHLCQYHLGR